MKTKIILNSLFGLVIGLVLFVPGSLAAAFGIAPPWITNETLKPGSNFSYIIDLNTNDPAMDMAVKITITGDPEILKWLTIINKDTLMMPAGQQHVPMAVNVNVPSDAKPGKYKGDIGVTVMPKNMDNAQDVSIFLGGHIAVKLDVINHDVTDYWVRAAGINPITEGQPVSVNLSVKNMGNTPITTLKTKIEVLNKNDEVVGRGEADALTKQIQPQTTDDAIVTIPVSGLLAGDYWVNVMAYKENKVVYQNKLYLEVNPTNVNNVLKTSVQVGNTADMLSAAPSYYGNNGMGNNVRVKTTVTVRAPLTNQLIGIVIIMLGILIIIAVKTQRVLFKKHTTHHHHKHH
jgi:hypothetical protein